MQKRKISEEEYNRIFAALKLIEALFLDGKIKYHVFKNILYDYDDIIDLSMFKCYT